MQSLVYTYIMMVSDISLVMEADSIVQSYLNITEHTTYHRPLVLFKFLPVSRSGV